ncbi:NUDIX hydrolase [Evansella sp. AB-P1]|uniref:NUDIX hydrolase n=1 Tax=Evansella sp. AB-P1 TaxID=3037653 RepID=UPI0024203896|nr:NUDIX hydrolase [Evansella sp. AB-P1]MDG5787149.1 NUDIX hydrolase [Evansella sp. AB-P1]
MGYVEDLRALVGKQPLIFVGAVAIIVDKVGDILLEERKYPVGAWGLPGGIMELGESTEDTVKREVYEETGLTINELNLLNVYSGPQYFTVAENGDEFYSVTIAYYSDNVEGVISVNESESISFSYFKRNELPKTIVKSHRRMIDDFLGKTFDER